MPRTTKKPATKRTPKRTSPKAGPARVTALRSPARDPSVVEVEIDGESVGTILRSALDDLRLTEGTTLGASARKRLDGAMERARARAIALRLLGRADRSVEFLVRALVERHGISDEAARATCADLAADGWQDDRRYAEARSQRLFDDRKASRALVVATLVEEGVDEGLAERTASRVAKASGTRDELARAILSGREALGERRATSQRDWRRVASHLARRGYDEDTVAAALERLGMREP